MIHICLSIYLLQFFFKCIYLIFFNESIYTYICVYVSIIFYFFYNGQEEGVKSFDTTSNQRAVIPFHPSTAGILLGVIKGLRLKPFCRARGNLLTRRLANAWGN